MGRYTDQVTWCSGPAAVPGLAAILVHPAMIIAPFYWVPGVEVVDTEKAMLIAWAGSFITPSYPHLWVTLVWSVDPTTTHWWHLLRLAPSQRSMSLGTMDGEVCAQVNHPHPKPCV